ncbi:MAG: diphthine synthase, partial [Candidatus Woesearchaeota archaeon]
ELYKFGKTTSMVFFADNWQPQTVYDVISMNKKQGLHTLILLDIKIAEPSKEDLLQQKQHVMPPTFMTIAQCIEQLFILEQVRNEHLITPHTQAVGCARLGGPDYMIKSGTLEILSTTDFGKPLHSLIIPGNLHFMEKEALELWK